MLKRILKIIFGILIFILVSFVSLILIVIVGGKLLVIESDYCIEDGDCKEGRKVNTKYGLIQINK